MDSETPGGTGRLRGDSPLFIFFPNPGKMAGIKILTDFEPSCPGFTEGGNPGTAMDDVAARRKPTATGLRLHNGDLRISMWNFPEETL